MASRLLSLLIGCGLAGPVGCGPPGMPAGTWSTTRTPARTEGTARGNVRPAPSYNGLPLPLKEASGPPGADRVYRQFVIPFDGQSFADQGAVAFSPDSSKLAFGVSTGAAVWDIGSDRLVCTMRLPEDARTSNAHVMVAFTPDGNRLVTSCYPDDRLRVWDAATGRLLATRQYPNPYARPGRDDPAGIVGLDPLGRRLALRLDGRSTQYEWALGEVEGKAEPAVLPGVDTIKYCGDFSPDGRSYAVGVGTRAVIWDIGSKAVTKTLTVGIGGPAWELRGVRFSHDGRFLATGAVGQSGVSVWEVSTGEVWARRVGAPRIAVSTTFSSDGRVVAVGPSFTLFDLLADRPVPEFPSPVVAGGGRSLTTSPDGKWFALVSSPWTYPVADSPRMAVYLARFPELPPPIRSGVDLAAAEVDEWWLALTSENRFRREYAEKLFRDRPEQTVAVAEQRLKPALDRDRRRVDDLIANLNDPDPEFRARVAADLAHYTGQFRPRLTAARDALKDGPMKTALTAALGKSDQAVEADVRGVAVLAGLNAPAARKLLTELATGAKGAALTDAAAAALQATPSK